MWELPITINVNDTTYNIRNNGDYRLVLDCFSALNDNQLDESYRAITALIIFYEDFNSIEDINACSCVPELYEEMIKFFNCGQSDSAFGAKQNVKLVDWEQDEQLIVSAINNVARTEVRLVSYIHWWTFMGYYNAIGESTFSTVVSIRNKIAKGKKLEKQEQEFRRNNPQYFVWKEELEQREQNQELLNNLWNKE